MFTEGLLSLDGRPDTLRDVPMSNNKTAPASKINVPITVVNPGYVSRHNEPMALGGDAEQLARDVV